MSTDHQTRDGERYPAILLTAGTNDNRVAPWNPFKSAARFQAATASGRQVLLRAESAGGHGLTPDADLRNAEFSDGIAFSRAAHANAFRKAVNLPISSLSSRNTCDVDPPLRSMLRHRRRVARTVPVRD